MVSWVGGVWGSGGWVGLMPSLENNVTTKSTKVAEGAGRFPSLQEPSRPWCPSWFLPSVRWILRDGRMDPKECQRALNGTGGRIENAGLYFAEKSRPRITGEPGMLIRLAAKTGIAPMLQAGKSGSLDAHDADMGQEDGGQKNEGHQPGQMRLSLFAPSPFFCPQSSCPTPAWRLFVIQPDQHRTDAPAGAKKSDTALGAGVHDGRKKNGFLTSLSTKISRVLEAGSAEIGRAHV